MDSQRDFGVLKRVGKAKVGRRIVGRIPTKDDQHVDLSGPHVRDQIFERFGLVDWIRVDRVGVENRFADIPECLIYGVSESVYDGRLMIAHDNDARSTMGEEILNKGPGETRIVSYYPPLYALMGK